MKKLLLMSLISTVMISQGFANPLANQGQQAPTIVKDGATITVKGDTSATTLLTNETNMKFEKGATLALEGNNTFAATYQNGTAATPTTPAKPGTATFEAGSKITLTPGTASATLKNVEGSLKIDHATITANAATGSSTIETDGANAQTAISASTFDITGSDAAITHTAGQTTLDSNIFNLTATTATVELNLAGTYAQEFQIKNTTLNVSGAGANKAATVKLTGPMVVENLQANLKDAPAQIISSNPIRFEGINTFSGAGNVTNKGSTTLAKGAAMNIAGTVNYTAEKAFTVEPTAKLNIGEAAIFNLDENLDLEHLTLEDRLNLKGKIKTTKANVSVSVNGTEIQEWLKNASATDVYFPTLELIIPGDGSSTLQIVDNTAAPVHVGYKIEEKSKATTDKQATTYKELVTSALKDVPMLTAEPTDSNLRKLFKGGSSITFDTPSLSQPNKDLNSPYFVDMCDSLDALVKKFDKEALTQNIDLRIDLSKVIAGTYIQSAGKYNDGLLTGNGNATTIKADDKAGKELKISKIDLYGSSGTAVQFGAAPVAPAVATLEKVTIGSDLSKLVKSVTFNFNTTTSPSAKNEIIVEGRGQLPKMEGTSTKNATLFIQKNGETTVEGDQPAFKKIDQQAGNTVIFKTATTIEQ